MTDFHELSEALSTLERAERESRMKDEFLAMLAHERRNPIGAIKSAVQVIEPPHGHGDTEVRVGNVVARQVGHLARLLDVDRAISGEVHLNRRPIDMAETVRLAVGDVTADAAPDRQIDISVEPAWIDGDAVRIEQVLTNLLTNAVKYTEAGSRILVALRGDGNDLVLTVEDTGVGIPPELLPFIFDVFVQGDRTLARTSGGGPGIGLPLVRRLVALHGGTIVASSDGPGHGSRFMVRLPQIPAPDPAPGAASPPGPVAPMRVLLIEDNRDAREMLKTMLEFGGDVVHDVADGVRGLEVLESEHPDVAIVDIGLPGLTGYQVARCIRAHPNGRAMLIVALTGYGLPSDYQNSVEAGFDHHLVKPIDLDELASLLAQHAQQIGEGNVPARSGANASP